MPKNEKKQLKDLNLLDDFLFSVAMEDLTICKTLLEIILGDTIISIHRKEPQREQKNLPGYKGIRLDVYIEDERGTIYDIEVQILNTGNLPRRSRFYQSLLDTPLLKSGDIDYNNLNDTYVIIISPFDLFGQEKYCYTFENICLEDGTVKLNDGAKKIFLNTKGKNYNEVSKELVDFLKYMENTTDECAINTKDERIIKLNEAIKRIKMSKEIGVAYVKTWEREEMIRSEGKAEGKAEGRAEGIIILLEEKGDVPQEIKMKIMDETKDDQLKKWLKLAARVDSIQSFIDNMG